MKLLLRLLVLLAIPAGLLGPGRDLTAFAVWWLTSSQPPELRLASPAGAVRGVIEVPVEALPRDRVDLLGADVDGRELATGASLRIDTGALPDGDHLLTVRAQDRSLRRNAASASLRFASDNTPPAFQVQAEPKSVPQGHTVVLHVQPSEPADVQASLGGTRLRLWPAGAEYWAVVGVDSDEKPGPQPVVVEGRDRVGNAGRSEAQVAVAPFKFTQDSLQVPNTMLPLLQPAVRAAEDERLAAIYRADNGPPRWKGPFLLPVLGAITTQFGEVRSYNGGPMQGHHGGTDFQAALGAPVQAPAPARVAFRDEVRLRGRILILDHGGGVYTTYAHLSDWLVAPDEEVQPGQSIAKVGTTGLSTGSHLHWELWVGGKVVDPLEWTEREVP